jgi:2-polyprenyl-3-methyl-5-hydroxy-6-metoxy-1,4-benzoquinol methylase
MADTQKNREVWQSTWDWSQGGEEWSAWWGGTEALWHGALLPRIHAFVPTGTILEIAPGFGRWTQFLKDLCDQLVVVDLAERCIEHCRERFAEDTHIEYHVNDGRSLDMVEDGSLDLAFSFDSLVHVEADVLDGYAHQLARKLKPDGVGFLHHSNIGQYRALVALARRAPASALPRLVASGAAIDLLAWRAESVTAESFAERAGAAGLACVAQEKINWEAGYYLIDAISLITPRGSRWERPRRVVANPLFRQEAKRMARLYASRSFPAAAGDGKG